MKTNILLTASIFALNAYAYAAPINSSELLNANEASKSSLTEKLVSNAYGRNQNAAGQIISNHKVSNEAVSSLMKLTLDIKKGRNLGLQSFTIKDLNKIDEMQFAIQKF